LGSEIFFHDSDYLDIYNCVGPWRTEYISLWANYLPCFKLRTTFNHPSVLFIVVPCPFNADWTKFAAIILNTQTTTCILESVLSLWQSAGCSSLMMVYVHRNMLEQIL